MVDLTSSPKKNRAQEIKTRVVAAIPCYNTQNHIADVVAKTKKYVDEVIVVDDGSTDMTSEVAMAAGAVVLIHPENRGKGAAMRTAVESVDADIIVFIDGDGQHDPVDIPRLIEPIVQGYSDFVIGSRYLKQSKLYANPFMRKAANAVASLVISFVISGAQPVARIVYRKPQFKKRHDEKNIQKEERSPGIHDYRILNKKFKWISDCTSGFTAMKKQNYCKLNLTSDGFQIETEMIFEQAKNGFIIVEIPISCTWQGSLSKLSVINDGFKTLTMLIRKLVNY